MKDVFSYRIDSEDKILAVSAEWLRFAKENMAADLEREFVVGRSLWQFITGDEVKHLYEIIFERARQTGDQIALPFRCDSPTERRFMELQALCVNISETPSPNQLM
ncbi:MAG: hypothetical protein HQ519_13975 [Planctomycetes bacterium]|nr:hypothetical protein [Planctomycetota bacterium]